MGAATLIIFLAVLHRYASGLAIPGVQDWLLALDFGWAQELCIYMFIWMAKFGAAYGVRTGIHVGVDVLVIRLPAEWRQKAVMVALMGNRIQICNIDRIKVINPQKCLYNLINVRGLAQVRTNGLVLLAQPLMGMNHSAVF